jgi:hypothetical protein
VLVDAVLSMAACDKLGIMTVMAASAPGHEILDRVEMIFVTRCLNS